MTGGPGDSDGPAHESRETVATGGPCHGHVTVVVPVKDRRESMLRCLEAVLAQDHPAFDIVVMDNGSTDGTAEACRERARTARVPVRVEVSPDYVGRRRNLGALLAEGEFVAYTDSDCLPTPNWLTAGTAALAEDLRLGVVQGRTLPEPGSPREPWDDTVEIERLTGRFETCNLFVRRDALLQAGGFAEDLYFFWEDTAGGWAIVHDGWTSGFAPDALVHHPVTYPGLRWWLRRAWRGYGNAAAIVRRDPRLRDDLLWGRYFLRPRNAAAAAAAAGLALTPVNRCALALALPYAAMRAPREHTPGAALRAGEVALFDLAVLASMIRGSLRHRCLVL